MIIPMHDAGQNEPQHEFGGSMARLPRPRTRRLCALLGLVVALSVAPPAVGQADLSLDLPAPGELPPGFVHQPELDHTRSDEGVVTMQCH